MMGGMPPSMEMMMMMGGEDVSGMAYQSSMQAGVYQNGMQGGAGADGGHAAAGGHTGRGTGRANMDSLAGEAQGRGGLGVWAWVLG